MKFKNIYKETKENVELSLLSLWTPGKHRMRNAMKDLFRREPLLADPVFQSIFPWRTTDDPNWETYLAPEVIQLQRDKAAERGEIYTPFKHQTESWNALNNGNSIVVTSGTGSGKTECFMLPVLSDLSSRKETPVNQTPIEAIFLYPLNALMQDQKTRLGKDCQKLGLRFAVYNRSLKERRPDGPVNQAYPDAEVRTRNNVRQADVNHPSCPQILLTNPSMLEFMLVRDRDLPVFNRSQGRLRWIIIDEAHTYSGSAAIELAYLIKRVLSAFGVTRDQVRFVCTSATIGDKNNPQELLDFIETLIGPFSQGNPHQLIHIDGDRVVPSLDAAPVQESLDNAGIIATNAEKVLHLRELVNRNPMSLSSIMKVLGTADLGIEEALDLLDGLCAIPTGKEFLLMLRGHFFMRMIDGLYACVNEECRKGVHIPHSGISHLTTYKGNGRCPHCGAPLFELVQCEDCKEFLLECEEDDTHRIRASFTTPETISVDYVEDNDVDPDEDSDDISNNAGPINDNWTRLYLSWHGETAPYLKPHPNYIAFRLALAWDGNDMTCEQNIPYKPWLTLRNREYQYCPSCAKGAGSDGRHFSNFRLSANWLNGIIAPALMKEGADAHNEWGKYIAFTDSRQGTAIYAKRFNADAERAFARTRLVKELSTPQIEPLLLPAVHQMMNNGRSYEESLQALGVDITKKPCFRMADVARIIFNQEIFEHLEYEAEHSGRPHVREEEAYKASLLRGIIGRKPIHLANIENLGLVTIIYPDINRVMTMPAGWSRSQLNLDDWKSFLRISLDYVFRMGNHLQCPSYHEYQYLRESEMSTPFNPADWPNVQRTRNTVNVRQHRLVLLLSAALGINNRIDLDSRENEVNTLLNETWTFLTNNLLKRVDAADPYYDRDENHLYDGWYYLDMSPSSSVCRLKITEKAWLCPVTNTILNSVFAGFSPNMTGTICLENLERFRVGDDAIIQMPILNEVGFTTRIETLKETGVWNDRLKYAYMESIQGYVTAEHSGQLNREILDHYTDEFKSEPRHHLNLLQCSTTMEMGVDIGDIDIVLMTNVPPTTANYMQRAGRAGRRGQNRAVSYSFCPNTAIGSQTFKNPMRILTSPNPASRPIESEIIVQRHMNSFFIREFILDQDIEFKRIDPWLRVGGLYETFCDWLNRNRTMSSLKSSFETIFGNRADRDMSMAIDITRNSMFEIADAYQTIIRDIDLAVAATNDQAKKDALCIQAEALKKQEPKGYLAEQQFLPNAAMPTGVVEFNHLDANQFTELKHKNDDLAQKEDQLAQGGLTPTEENNLKREIAKLEERIKQILENAISSREIKIALSEYAPGQTVVINEKNYISAGIEWLNSLGQQQPWKYLYHCPTCGRYEYSNDPVLTICPNCNSNYEGYLFPNNTHCTFAIEPTRFRTDVNLGINRREQTKKAYYDIQTILTDVEWENCTHGPMYDLVGSEDAGGEIVFVNAGKGNGFTLCLECGKMVVTTGDIDATNWPHNYIGDKGHACPVNPRNNILLCGRFPTSFVSIRLYKDTIGDEFESDTDLLYSIGVLLCRALTKIEGISVDDIDFDVRQEFDLQGQNHYASIFIYDTQKGGCGYSTRLLDPHTCQQVFEKAQAMLASYNCHCENQVRGACVNCLIDRQSQRIEGHLSKYKLLEWFSRLPTPINPLPQGATVVPTPLKYLLTRLYCAPSTRALTFCVDSHEMNLNDWTHKEGAMGRILAECARRGIQLHLLVANVPTDRPEDMLPFIDLPSKFQNWGVDVKAIDSLGLPGEKETALIVNDNDHYFTNQSDVLPFSQDWGEKCVILFENHEIPVFTFKAFPTAQDVFALMRPNEITRTGTVTGRISATVGSFYSSAIKRNLLRDGDEQAIKDILEGKQVNITFSDSYVNSALAGLMLVYMLKEIRNLYGFQIASINLRIRGPKRNCDNSRWNDYNQISYNFPSGEEADEYLQELFSSVLDIEPHFSDIEPSHYRWIRLRPEDSNSYVEIRPDYGISGGWKSNEIYWDLDRLDGSTVIQLKPDAYLVYYLLIRKR